MPDLDQRAIVSLVANWFERWYAVCLLVGNSLTVVLAVICTGHPEIEETLVRIVFTF